MDGKALAQQIKVEIAAAVVKLDKPIGLGTILVNDDPASVAYVAGKHKDCAEVGIKSIRVNLPATASTQDVISAVNKLNDENNCTGFIVQLPLPQTIDTQKVLSAIDPNKDADGITPSNIGKLALGYDTIIACTPKATVSLLAKYKINLAGRQVLVLGRGATVGRPLSILLSQKSINATVTLAHSASQNLSALIASADVVISAVGVAGFIKPAMIKPGSVLVDVGITRVKDRLVGDFDPGVIDIVRAFAPMPGGVGPLTRAMLLKNVFDMRAS
jgi:methylenetetrahydrofolate dehydrogenase (NADP+)/methenyltetrahydrofolate cyclohydrolase